MEGLTWERSVCYIGLIWNFMKPYINAIEIVVPNKFVSGLTNLKHFILCHETSTKDLKKINMQMTLSNLSNGLLLSCAILFNCLHDWRFICWLHFRKLLS